MTIDLNAQLFGMSILEMVAAVLGLVSVWLTVKENVWNWPIGAVMVALYFVVFYQARLYADMGLQVVFFGLQFYGWYQWLHGGDQHAELPIRRATGLQLFIPAILGVLGTASLGWSLGRWTNAALPYVDSTATALSLVAQWLLARKLLENWLVWIAVDVLSIGIYLYKELYPTTVLYGIFLGMAILGYREWMKSYRARTPA